MECEICQGSRRIRLPRYKPLVMTSPGDIESIDLSDHSTEYPCPECSAGDHIPCERLNIVKGAVDGPERLADKPEFLEMMRGHMASALGAKMLKDGMIQFEQSPVDHRGKFALRGMVGVVAPQHVAEFEERVRERQFEVAAGLVEATKEEIANWGSYYHGREGGRVEKWQAVEWLQDAFKKVQAKFAKAA